MATSTTELLIVPTAHLTEDTPDSVVADRAGVQAPTIYRLFGDKEGLLDAVAVHGMVVFAAGTGAILATLAESASDRGYTPAGSMIQAVLDPGRPRAADDGR